MKLRSFLSLFCLIACICAPFVVSESFAGQTELGEITKAIKQKNSLWSANHTSFSALTPEARKKRLGSKYPLPSFAEKTLSASSASLPLRLDWRNYNGNSYVTPVKEQGECGACWAFAVTAALESRILISQNTPPGTPIDLSEQMLISCSGAGTCSAGAINAASDFVSNYGLPPESCFPYTDADGLCSNSCPDWENGAYRIAGWSLVNPTIDAIKHALYDHGPLVTLMAAQTDFFYYSSGIYSHAWGSFEGYHAALIVGYDDSEQYFIVKSSWGTDWGEAGYFRIAYSEINSETIFGCWSIAYESLISSGFPTIDGIARDAGTSADKDKSASGNAGAGDGTGTGNNTTGSGDGTSGDGNNPGDDNQGKDKSDPAATSALTGKVRDETGSPISGGEIKAGKYTATTNEDGYYLISSLPSGDYTVTAGKKGYASAFANICILPQSAFTKDFILTSTSNAITTMPASLRSSKTQRVTAEELARMFAVKQNKSKSSQIPLASIAADHSAPEIVALARALHNNPQQIFDYVYNNIDYIPYYGLKKGALLTYLDGSGNDFDQASLMIALLRASNISASYRIGKKTIDNQDLANWLGVEINQTNFVLAYSNIPFEPISGQNKTSMVRAWVITNGVEYDPARKKYISMHACLLNSRTNIVVYRDAL